MGNNISKEGIVKDLEWFKKTGIGSATVFGIADICTPWATKIKNAPNEGLVAFTDDWWKLLRFACDEAKKRGIELGLHNCPGYTSTGGPWIPPHLAMRELVFNITNAEKQISITANAPYPVQHGVTGKFGRPEIPSRHTDLQEIATVDGVRVQHIPMGSFTQPNQWETFGLECDKMNPEAISFHLDHVIGEMKKHLGEHVGTTLKFVLLDSYEAGKPTWTPNMRAEFKARRGYDPLPYLPILGGYPVKAAQTPEAIHKFRVDYDKTISELYRDVLFKIMREKLSAVNLEFACEPYGGPFNSQQCAAHVDRLMTEFWLNPNLNRRIRNRSDWMNWIGPDGKRHNILEAEAFTGQPGNCQWTETPCIIKAAADTQFDCGINRMILHTCPLQPWSDEFKPGKTMGRWGTHFGRHQTWADAGKELFGYLNRCQALLQWGEPTATRIIGHDITPQGTHISANGRISGDTLIYFVVNHSDKPASMNMGLPIDDNAPEWFDPVSGRITTLRLTNGRVPIQLAPCQTGFLVLRKTKPAKGPDGESTYLQNIVKPYCAENGIDVNTPWTVKFGTKTLTMNKLEDWTVNLDADIKYFSGTASYRTSVNIPQGFKSGILSLGNCNGQIAKVSLNGREVATLWCYPYEIRLVNDIIKPGTNTIEIEFTNVWANRLIGDEQEPADCEFQKAPFPGGHFLARFPDWFKDGIKARPSKNRKCFTDWNYFNKDSKLIPSGLIGPVKIYPSDF